MDEIQKAILEAQIAYAEAQANAADEYAQTLRELLGEEETPEEKPAAKKAAPAKATPAKKAAAPAKKTAPAKKAAAKPVEPEPEEDEEDEEAERVSELKAMPLSALRALAIKKGFDEAEVKKEKDKDLLANGIYADELANPDEDAEDEDEEDAEEEGQEVQYTREDLKTKNLRELRALAKEAGIEHPRSADADTIIDLMLGDDEEDADEADEDAEEPITEDDLKAMSPAQLKVLCKEWGVTVKRGMTHEQMVTALLDKAEEDAAEEE